MIGLSRRYALYLVALIVVGGVLFGANRYGCEAHPGDKTAVKSFSGGSTVMWEARPPDAASYDYGDIIVYSPPHAPETIALGRLIGKPGDRIGMAGGRVRRNGAPIPDDFGDPEDRREVRPAILIPAETFFILGDRAAKSQPDSRVFGPIAIGTVRGAAVNVE